MGTAGVKEKLRQPEIKRIQKQTKRIFCVTMRKNAYKWLILRIYGIIKPVFMKAHDFRERHQELLLFYFRTTDPDERKVNIWNGRKVRLSIPPWKVR